MNRRRNLNDPPRMPYRLNGNSPLAKGLIGWWPMFNKQDSAALDSTTSNVYPQYFNMAPGAKPTETLKFEDLENTAGLSHIPDKSWGVTTYNADGLAEDDQSALEIEDSTPGKFRAKASGDIHTCLAWAWLTEVDDRAALVGNDTTYSNGWAVHYEQSAGAYYAWNGKWNVVSSSQPVAAGEWHRVGIRMRQEGVDRYANAIVDGIVSSDSAVRTNGAPTGDFFVGSLNSNRRFLGFIGNVCYWNRDLSQGELDFDYMHGRWDLFQEPVRRRWSTQVAAPAGGIEVLRRRIEGA